jgi:hypothetical protein
VRKALIAALAASFVLANADGAAASDASATHAYIQANYALARGGVARIGAVQAKIEALNASLAQRCPGAGAGSPQTEASQPMAQEIVAAMWSIAYGTNGRAIATFVSTTTHLRWSNGEITRIVERYARSLHTLATLPVREICGDVHAWAGTGFTLAPRAVVELDQRAEASTLEPVPARLLAPYERGSDASVLARTTALETKLEESEFSLGQSDWFQILGTLGLQQ